MRRLLLSFGGQLLLASEVSCIHQVRQIRLVCLLQLADHLRKWQVRLGLLSVVVTLRVRELRLSEPRNDVWTPCLVNVFHVFNCHWLWFRNLVRFIRLHLVSQLLVRRTPVEVRIATEHLWLRVFNCLHLFLQGLLLGLWSWQILNSFANICNDI